MKVVTAGQMQIIDRKTIEEYGLPGQVLMERAGLAVSGRIREFYSRRRCIVIAGSGNNGGDGLVIARNLHCDGWDVRVFLMVRPEDLKGDAMSEYHAVIHFGVPVSPVQEFIDHSASVITRHSVIVDAVFGTGLRKNIAGVAADVIRLINQSNVPVIAVDVPSGISSDTGQIMGVAVKADMTVTFGLPKRGHILHPGAEFSGRLFIEDIGFPQELTGSQTIPVDLIGKKDIAGIVPARKRYSHKGTYGHVLIVAGSKGKTGAACMAARACLRAGAGLVTIGIPESLADIFQSLVREEMVLVLPDKGNGTLSARSSRRILDFLKEKAGVLAIGPGIGVTADTEMLLANLVENSAAPMVIDADGINSVRGDRKIFAKTKATVILTPHPGEMARFLQKTGGRKQAGKSSRQSYQELVAEIEKDRISSALSLARETNTVLVLKGVPTVIATPDGHAFVNSTGNPGMATGGTGDVLTGMIAGFLSQNRNPVQAVLTGVYLHGLAGDIAASQRGEYSLIATDIIEHIPDAFYSLSEAGG